MVVYEPKILKNPSKSVVEFRYGGKLFIFQPGEERLIEGVVANHALRFVNTGFIDVTHKKAVDSPLEPKKEMSEEEMAVAKDFDQMSWKDLVKAASRLGKYKPGMKRKELLEVLQGKPI